MPADKDIFDIVILTDNRYVNPTTTNWYIDQVLLEDQLLQTALEDKGLNVCKKDWADSNFDWTKTKYAIFRTTWDYFDRFDEFLSWLDQTKNKTTFINSAEVINWNIDKHYLQDLTTNNINIAPTLFIEKGDYAITDAAIASLTKIIESNPLTIIDIEINVRINDALSPEI